MINVPMVYCNPKTGRRKIVDEKMYLLMPEMYRLMGKVHFDGDEIWVFTDREKEEGEE